MFRPRGGVLGRDTTRFDVLDSSGETVGFLDFTKELRYLGSIVNYSLSSEADVDKRIKSGRSKTSSPTGSLISNSKVESIQAYSTVTNMLGVRSFLEK